MPAMPFPVAGTVKRCRHRSMRESSFPVFGLVLGEISQRATRCIDCRCRRPDARERPRKQQVSKSDIARSTNRTPVIGCRSCETHESKTFARGKILLFRSVPRQRRCIAMRYASACWSLGEESLMVHRAGTIRRHQSVDGKPPSERPRASVCIRSRSAFAGSRLARCAGRRAPA